MFCISFALAVATIPTEATQGRSLLAHLLQGVEKLGKNGGIHGLGSVCYRVGGSGENKLKSGVEFLLPSMLYFLKDLQTSK